MTRIRRWRAWWVGLLVGVVLMAVPLSSQSTSTQIQVAINALVTGVTPFTALRTATSSYMNWGSTQGVNGYGIRDNAGNIEVKNSGGAWTVVVGGSGNPTAASYWTRVPEASLTNETALSALGTAILVNTTATGVPTAYAGTTCTAQYLQALSAVGAGTCATVNLLTETSGTVSVGRGGTGLTTGTAGGVLAFSSASTIVSSAALTANAIVLGSGTGAPTALGSLGTTTTLLHGNAGGAPTFTAVSLTADVTGILPSANGGTANAFFTVSGPAASAKTFTFPNANATILTSAAAITAGQGGTGLTTYAVGDIIFASAVTPTLSRLADVATGNALISGGLNTAPAWGKIALTTHVTGTLPATNGGTGQASYLQGDVLYANSTTTVAGLADVAAGRFLRSAGANTAPAYSTTIWTNAATTGDLLAASAANTYSNIAAVATGQVLISQGVTTLPAWSTALAISTVNLGTTLALSATAPTISSGFGTSPTVTGGTSASFRVNVGTGGTANSGVVGMPTAATGWNCSVNDLTSHTAHDTNEQTFQIASTTTTVSVEHQNPSTGAVTAWSASDILSFACIAY